MYKRQDYTYVQAIARCGNISKAAESLYISQPSLSKFLQKLEEQVGTPLFERINKRMIPTYAGEQFLETGEQIDVYKRQVYNGELYNTDELRADLRSCGHTFLTSSDTEVILAGYMEYGPDFVKRLNGIFAFAVYDPVKDCLALFRDRAGVKPCLFYTSPRRGCCWPRRRSQRP